MSLFCVCHLLLGMGSRFSYDPSNGPLALVVPPCIYFFHLFFAFQVNPPIPVLHTPHLSINYISYFLFFGVGGRSFPYSIANLFSESMLFYVWMLGLVNFSAFWPLCTSLFLVVVYFSNSLLKIRTRGFLGFSPKSEVHTRGWHSLLLAGCLDLGNPNNVPKASSILRPQVFITLLPLQGL